MAALSAITPQLRPWAPVQRFQEADAAVRATLLYEASLCERAAHKRSRGVSVVDQDEPDVVFCLYSAHPQVAPLAIVGGMGPMCGADAFRRACTRFGDSRTVVLYQACSMPDRSTLIVGEGDRESPRCRSMALRLAEAVRRAVSIAGTSTQRVRCILACNSAHYFFPLLEHDLRGSALHAACDVQMISLVTCAVEAVRSRVCRRALLLATEGARVGQVFSVPFRDAGIAFDEPSPAQDVLLMRVIFEGLKAVDPRRAVELGNEFFETVLRTGRDYDCVVAGCTEVALTLDLLRCPGSSAVAAFLSHMKIVDPLEEALRRA